MRNILFPSAPPAQQQQQQQQQQQLVPLGTSFPSPAADNIFIVTQSPIIYNQLRIKIRGQGADRGQRLGLSMD